MEMGRIAEFSQFDVGEGWKQRNRSGVEDVHEDEKEIDAEGHVRERRNSFLEREQMGKDGFAQSSNYQRQQGSQGDFLDVDTRVEPEPHTATTDTMTESVHKPPLPRIETHPSENEAHGTPVSRHARFAPSPPRSAPTQQSNNDAQAKQPSSSWSLFHWRRNTIPIPSYLISVYSGKNSKPLRNYKFHPS
ncbi:hypothetical protein FRC02_002375 [Tulasnella sp. 418]|nr:hypothetical protein FRC02_002375 [Tulasnella sp. 418]